MDHGQAGSRQMRNAWATRRINEPGALGKASCRLKRKGADLLATHATGRERLYQRIDEFHGPGHVDGARAVSDVIRKHG